MNINKIKHKTMKKLIATAAFLVIGGIALISQTPPPPNGGGNPGSGNTPVGGGAPVGSGLVILLALGTGYGAKKVYDFRKRKPIN